MQLLHAIFRNNANFAALTDKAKTLTMTQKIWSEIVPEAFKSASQAGNIEHKRLTVYVVNGAVAAKIKLLLPSLLTKLKRTALKSVPFGYKFRCKQPRKGPKNQTDH